MLGAYIFGCDISTESNTRLYQTKNTTDIKELVEDNNQCKPMIASLIAGQKYKIGEVHVCNDMDSIYISFYISDNWNNIF